MMSHGKIDQVQIILIFVAEKKGCNLFSPSMRSFIYLYSKDILC